MNILKLTWRILADLAGVVATLSILIAFSSNAYTKLLEYIDNDIRYAAALIFAFSLSTIYLGKRLWNHLMAFTNTVRKDEVNKDFSAKTIVDSNLDLSQYIPTSSSLKRAFKSAESEAKEWARDAVVTSFNLYISKEGNEIEKRLQIFALSEWKDEQLTFYYPELTKKYEKTPSYLLGNGYEYFFFNESGWERAVLMVFERYSSQVVHGFGCQVSGDSSGSVHINLSYKNGRREERQRYTYRDKILTAEDGMEIPVP